MLGTEGWENAIAGIQNSLEFIPKSKADRDLLCGSGEGNSATAFRLQVAPGCSPEIEASSTMMSVDEDPTYAPHTVRMRILGLTGVSVEEPDVSENTQPPPPKYMKSAVAVTRASNLYATSPLSKRLVRASNQSPNHRYIAIWDSSNNNRASDTNSVTFDVNLPVSEPEEQEQPTLQRSMPHRSYELIVGLAASKRHKPTPVGAAGLPLEEATKLRSKSGKIVLDLPVFNFASLNSDPFATPESRTWRQLSIRRNSSVSATTPLSPNQMEKVAFYQEQKIDALGCNCYMDPAKDAAVLRIELEIQRKVLPKERATLPESSMVLVQPRVDGIEMAHSEMENSASDSGFAEMESSFERIPHIFGENEGPAEASQYRVRIVDNTTMDCSLSQVRLQQKFTRNEPGTKQHDVEYETKPTRRNQKNGVFASLLHAVKKPAFTEPRTKEDSSQRSVTEKSSVPSMEQVTVSSTSESDTLSYRLLDSIKILPSPPRPTTAKPPPAPSDVTFKPITSSPPVNHEDESRQDKRANTKGDADSEVSVALEQMRDSLIPYARGMEEFFSYNGEDNDDVLDSLDESYTVEESIRRDDVKGNFDEFVGALNDMCHPLNLSDEHADGTSVSFRRKPNWVSAVLDGLSEEESSCESRSTVTDEANTSFLKLEDEANTTFLQMDDETEQGEEIDVNDMKIAQTSSFSWAMLRRKTPPSDKHYPPQPAPRLRKKIDAIKPQPFNSKELLKAQENNRPANPNKPNVFEPFIERSQTPLTGSKVKITETSNPGTADEYSKPVADFRTGVAKMEFQPPMASPLCFSTSVVDVVSNAFIPTPTPAKVPTEPVQEMPQPNAQISLNEGETTPPIPDVLVNYRDNASVGDLTATSHEMQVDIEEFKLLIKQHLEAAKKPNSKLKDLSFVKNDEKLYAGVDDSWCKGL